MTTDADEPKRGLALRDPDLAQTPTEELMQQGFFLTKMAKEYDTKAREAREQRCAIVDELNRHRDPKAPDDDPFGGRHVATCAGAWKMRFQSLRSSLQAWWDSHEIEYSPDHRPVITDQDQADIRQRYLGGEPKRTIASDYGIARATVAKIVEDIDAERAEAKRRAAIAAEEAVENLTQRVQST